MRKRVNGITKNKGAVYKGAVVLSTIFIFGVSMKVVYSNSKFDIKFKYAFKEVYKRKYINITNISPLLNTK